MENFVIARRFCGPPASGNGGYVAGRLAGCVGDTARVRLHRPPPLDTPLRVRRAAEGVHLLADDGLVAEARPCDVEIEVPASPGFAAAERAAHEFRGFERHPYPGCFVCGTNRAAGDGLRIFAGPSGPPGVVAAPWVPDAAASGRGRVVPRELVWAALDCPGAFTFDAPPHGTVLLGELSVRMVGPVVAGERCVIVAWHRGRDGRKHDVGSAIYTETGTCRAVARATWIEVAAGRARVGEAVSEERRVGV